MMSLVLMQYPSLVMGRELIVTNLFFTQYEASKTFVVIPKVTSTVGIVNITEFFTTWRLWKIFKRRVVNLLERSLKEDHKTLNSRLDLKIILNGRLISILRILCLNLL